jgi:hypothetical protein
MCDLTLSVSAFAMHNHVVFYMELRRYQDALVLQEKNLELFRRVLPDDHPIIGLSWLS